MCGRITRRLTWRQLHQLLDLMSWTDPEPGERYNVAPTQAAPIVRAGVNGREGVMMRWGLIPAWAGSADAGPRNFNARSETVASKPSFRDSFRTRRCLTPVSGFYEWRALPSGKKQPHYITRRDGEPFMLAALWDRWDASLNRDASPLESFAILTTAPNCMMKPLHDRMPVILRPSDYARWLEPRPLTNFDAAELFRPIDDDAFEAFPVAPLVSNARNDGVELTRRVAEEHAQAGFLF